MIAARPTRERSRAYLDWIKQLPCIACACDGVTTHGCDPAHVSYLQPRGMGQKTGDQWTLPLCRPHHDEQHDNPPEARWWARLGVDPRRLCTDLRALCPDLAAGDATIFTVAQRAKRLPRLITGGELLAPATLTRTVLVEAQTSDDRDGDGNVIVHLPTLGPHGTPPTRAAVDPHSIQEPSRG